MATGDISRLGRYGFRKWAEDGVAASGPNKPSTIDIFPFVDEIDDAVATLGESIEEVRTLAVSGSTPGINVALATTTNITLSGEQTIDGTLTSATRILVKDQSVATGNGVYVTGAGAWTRATDADTGAELLRKSFFVSGGTANEGKTFIASNTAITVGSTDIQFVLTSDASAALSEVVDARGTYATVEDRLDASDAITDPLVNSLTIGRSVTPVTSASVTQDSTYVMMDAATFDGEISTIRMFGVNSGGTLKLKVFNKDGDTFSQVGDDVDIAIAVGLTTLIAPGDFTAVSIRAGQHIGFYAFATTGKIARTVTTADGTGFRGGSGNVTSFVDSTSSTDSRPEIGFDITTSVSLARVETIEGYLEGGSIQSIGRPDRVVTGSAIGDSTYVFATPVAADGIMRALRVYALSAGTIYVKFFTKAGDDFTQVDEDIPYSVVAGQNLFLLDSPIRVAANWYLGLFADGIIAVNSGSTSDSGGYYAASGNVASFTDSSATTNNLINLGADFYPTASETIGRPITVVTGTAISDRTYVFEDAATIGGYIQSIRYFGIAAGTAYLSVWYKDGNDFTRLSVTEIPILTGSRAYKLTDPLPISAGQHVGIFCYGLISANASVTGDSGGYRDSGPSSGNVASFTDTGVTTNVLLNLGVDIYEVDPREIGLKVSDLESRVSVAEAAISELQGGVTTNDLPTEWDVFFAVMSQSNIDGRGTGGATPTAGTAKMWKSYDHGAGTGIKDLADPVGNTVDSAGSMWPAFATEYFRRTGRGVIINCQAVGGTSLITHWGSGGSLRGTSMTAWDAMITALDSSGLCYRIAGIISGIGETDGDSITAASITQGDFETAFNSDLTFFLGASGIDTGTKTPVIIIQTGVKSTGDTAGFIAVRESQVGFVRDNDNVWMGTTVAKSFEDRGLMADTYHYFQAGYDEIGRLTAAVAAVRCFGFA